MNRSLSIAVAFAGALFAGSAMAQSTTGDPTGIKVLDEPTIAQQRGAVGTSTFSTVPRDQRNPWDGGTLDDLNLDGLTD
jgi:uncharacterized lipoprotein YajG